MASEQLTMQNGIIKAINSTNYDFNQADINNSFQMISHTNLLMNETKYIVIKGFYQNIRQLKVGVYEFKNNIPFC